MKILYLTNIPSPYMIDFLNELGKRSELTVIFERAASGVRDKSWKQFSFHNFEGIILRGINVKINEDLDDQAICPQIITYIVKKKYDIIIVANPCTPTGMIAILYMKIKRIPYAIQSEGGFAKDGKGIKEKIKKLVMGKAALYFSTAPIGDNYFIQYGAEISKIHRYPFTSLYESDILKKPLAHEEKQLIKEALDIPYEKIVISIGRFIPIKGFDVIIQACSDLGKNIGIYLIGGNPTEEFLRLKRELKMTNLHFIDHLNRDEIKKYYSASDIFVLNSRGDTWGLVINEAMSFGLPVISSDKCYAALALIENDKNGYIVQTDDSEAFTEKISYLLHTPAKMGEMAENNIIKSQQYTLEKMAERELEILEEFLV